MYDNVKSIYILQSQTSRSSRIRIVCKLRQKKTDLSSRNERFKWKELPSWPFYKSSSIIDACCRFEWAFSLSCIMCWTFFLSNSIHELYAKSAILKAFIKQKLVPQKWKKTRFVKLQLLFQMLSHINLFYGLRVKSY